MNDFQPRLYIIMRKDIPDMNPGKGMAQAAHAQANFSELANNLPSAYMFDNPRRAIADWKEDRSFGTTIVLEAMFEDLKFIIESSTASGYVVDPTYPIINAYGFTYTEEMITCGWVFV